MGVINRSGGGWELLIGAWVGVCLQSYESLKGSRVTERPTSELVRIAFLEFTDQFMG